jgi:hypothetical protein
VDSLPNSWVLEEQLMLGSREELDQLVLASAPPTGGFKNSLYPKIKRRECRTPTSVYHLL